MALNYNHADYVFNYLQELASEIAELERQRDDIEAQLKKVFLVFHPYP